MANLEVIAHLKIRPGQLEGFKAQAAEMLRITREKDTQTVRYDWFIDEDAMQCEVHEAYLTEAGIFEHSMNVFDVRARLFKDYAYDHRMSFYGDVSQQLMDIAHEHAEEAHAFAFVQGLQSPVTV